jgi:thiol:disulfide interchange protein/DsbC/DsbD-like thiol-disulfide interchange protein
MSSRLVRILRPLMSMLLVSLASAAVFAADRGSEYSSLELLSIPDSARGLAVIEDQTPQVQARLLVSSGATREVGVLFDLAPGWHLYWRNPGETGIAPDLGLEADQHRVGDIAWPAPTVFREADGLFTTYGYERAVLLIAPLEAISAEADGDGDGASGDAFVRANASVLVCRTQCVPTSFELSTPIETALSKRDQSEVEALFHETHTRVPAIAATLGIEGEAHWVEGAPEPDATARLEVVVRSCKEPGEPCQSPADSNASSVFLPMEGETFEFSGVSLVGAGDAAKPGSFTMVLDALRLEPGADRLRGLVQVSAPDGQTQHVEIDLPITSGAMQVATPAAVSSGRWMQIFLLALLGGLILNGMPCVLPVLAIKVVAIADMAEKDPRDVRLNGLAYTAGVLGSMALLAAVVVGLRSAGHSVGWGFQFQEPLFVAGISALLVAFALNLFGVFEIEFGQGRLASVGQDSTGLRRSVFEGLLAVVLATPCTAPFLGTAVGFAFATSDAGIAAIFLAIGLGLASPFLLVSFFPRLARFIPKSGPWMLKLRTCLGFSLLATVIWLLWVLGQTGGSTAIIAMVANLLFFAFLLWGFGQLQPLQSALLGRAAAVAIVGLTAVGFNLIDLDRAQARTEEARAIKSGPAQEDGWQVYSERAVEEALSAGRPAFVVFTADWCITCQVNEKTVLERESVRQALEERGFALFKADWTRRDETIRQKLAEFGRAGVPLYLVYAPDAPSRPQVLSELLTQREVIAALANPRLAARD